MSVSRLNPVFVVGPLPPPVHGASVITSAVVALLQSSGARIFECNNSPRMQLRGWRWHLNRAMAYARGFRQIVAGSAGSTVYVALSGGNGLFYDLMIVLAARLRAHRVVLHHHSFAYIDHHRGVFALLLRIAPKAHVHVVLCQEMGQKLATRYRTPLNCVHVSNLSFFPPNSITAEGRREMRNIGFLSHITLGKGIDRFLDLAAMLVSDRELAFHIAGSFADEATRAYVQGRIAELPNVTAHGPVFDDAKRAFYRSIDAFVFPSRYASEAEPLVIYEAMAAGLPVIVTARGCLCDMVDADTALVLDRDGHDVELAAHQIVKWKNDPDSYAAASAASIRRVRGLNLARDRQRADFLNIFDLSLAPSSAAGVPVQQTA